jgi:hypothetical protein
VRVLRLDAQELLHHWGVFFEAFCGGITGVHMCRHDLARRPPQCSLI